jgi:hypothetical protein
LFSGSFHVDVDEYPVSGLSLAAMARDRIALVQVWMFAEIESDRSA